MDFYLSILVQSFDKLHFALYQELLKIFQEDELKYSNVYKLTMIQFLSCFIMTTAILGLPIFFIIRYLINKKYTNKMNIEKEDKINSEEKEKEILIENNEKKENPEEKLSKRVNENMDDFPENKGIHKEKKEESDKKLI